MTDAEIYFHELAKEIPDVKEGKMFGSLCLKTPNGKSPAMFWKDCLIVKLDGAAMADALALDGTNVFEPMEGRPMTGWIQVPFEYKDKWKPWATVATNVVKEIPEKPTAKKKK